MSISPLTKIYHTIDSLPREYAEVITWLQEICRRNNVRDYVTVDHNPNADIFNFTIYTKNYKYRIACRPVSIMKKEFHGGKESGASNSPSYLGAQVMSRKPRAGEDWNRGNDLADGPYNRGTWTKIKNDILEYELVKVAKQKEHIYKGELYKTIPETPDDCLENPSGTPAPEGNHIQKG